MGCEKKDNGAHFRVTFETCRPPTMKTQRGQSLKRSSKAESPEPAPPQGTPPHGDAAPVTLESSPPVSLMAPPAGEYREPHPQGAMPPLAGGPGEPPHGVSDETRPQGAMTPRAGGLDGAPLQGTMMVPPAGGFGGTDTPMMGASGPAVPETFGTAAPEGGPMTGDTAGGAPQGGPDGGAGGGGGGGAGGGGMGTGDLTPSDECVATYKDDGTCMDDGSSHYVDMMMEYSAETGVFTGQMITNLCNAKPNPEFEANPTCVVLVRSYRQKWTI